MGAGIDDRARRRDLAAVAAAYGVALAGALAVGSALLGRPPLLVAAVADLAATAIVFAASVRYDNSSAYDPYWSVAPAPIAVYWAWAEGAFAASPARAGLVLALVTAWGFRLTANWAARWRGFGDEDFRYVEIRARAGRAYWPASLVAIHLMPTAWVFLGLLPVYAALAAGGRPFGPLDLAAAAVTAVAIAVEAAADAQLRAFVRSRRDPEAALSTGLWAWSRHPNYFGEVLFWWGLWLFGVAARPAWAWTAVGPASITLLFLLVSVPWMDRRMRSRHPAWGERTRTTSALVPWPPQRR
jgi:steroid 5-alpha reductase family enzyme